MLTDNFPLNVLATKVCLDAAAVKKMSVSGHGTRQTGIKLLFIIIWVFCGYFVSSIPLQRVDDQSKELSSSAVPVSLPVTTLESISALPVTTLASALVLVSWLPVT